MTTSRHRSAAVLLIGLTPIALVGCGRTQDVTTASDVAPAAVAPAPAPVPPGPTTSVAPPPEAGPADPTKGVDGMRPGQPVLVTTFGDDPPVGYVAWEDWNTPSDAYRVVPITDIAGKQIGWWLNGAGWVDLATVADPGFDAKAYVAATTARMASPEGVANG